MHVDSTNQSTLAVASWLMSDDRANAAIAKTARVFWEKAGEGDPLTRADRTREAMAGWLQTKFEEQNPLKAHETTLYGVLMASALRSVEWDEIADSCLREAELGGYLGRRESIALEAIDL